MTFRKHLDKGTDQDGRVGRLFAPLLPWHTKIVTIYRATVDKKDQKTSRKDLQKRSSPTKAIKKDKKEVWR